MALFRNGRFDLDAELLDGDSSDTLNVGSFGGRSAVPDRGKSVMREPFRGFLLLAVLLVGSASRAEDEFRGVIQPVLRESCLGCHSTERKKGDLDLERFTSAEQAKQQPKVWESVLEQLANNEMPPKDQPRLTPERKATLTNWARRTLDQIALANAGDPGPVVLRRLSNWEYTYSIRDLTGVEALDPAREFPVDGAAGEGFTNAGAALAMSPALLTKYLDAAKGIAEHAVLLPNGLRFSPSSSPRDWTNESLAKVRAFYAEFTSPLDAQVMVGGAGLVHSDGGRIPLEKYLAALTRERTPLATGSKGIADAAREHRLNAKYLGLLWSMLHDPRPSLLLDSLRAKWRSGTLTAEDIEIWQKSLWRFTTVGHIGKANGPKAWQEPVTPLASRQELRLKLDPPANGKDVMVYLAVSDAGDGSEHDFALWENPRLVAPGRADLPLREVGAALRQQNPPSNDGSPSPYGLSPTLFGAHPTGGSVDPTSLCVQAPSLLEMKLPAALVDGAELVVGGRLHPVSGAEGGVRMRVSTTKPDALTGAAAIRADTAGPIIVSDNSQARRRWETAFDDFRRLFPAAVCYTKIVPVDEVVTLTLYYREDEPLRRLLLDERESAELDRLWNELLFIAQEPIALTAAFEQISEFATQDRPDMVQALAPMRQPIFDRAEAFRQRLVAVEPRQLEAALRFADQAWRRSLSAAERQALRDFYAHLRKSDIAHADAIRLLLARILTSPAFLYRGETAGPGRTPSPVSDWELATRLSYFLWSSVPDDELRSLAASGTLRETEVLTAQTRRMLKDAKIRRLATEFGCQWLHVRDLDTLDEKSERHFPTFAALRGDMREEILRFFTDLFQHDRSVLSLLDADHTFVNGSLARHYGMDLQTDEWQRIEGLRSRGRGGLLGFAGTLAKQSGASRTSPILRGNWLSEVVLGEKLPRPPKDVPVLPDEPPSGLTERQLIERHSSDAQCARCHQRLDPFGFALEGFDAIGRARSQDASGLPIDTATKLPDGGQIEGVEGLRAYLLEQRRDDFLRQFCRKLLGFALGRGVQLSDKPLLDTMLSELKANEYRVGTAVELIVRSPQFRQVRGRDFAENH